MIHLCYYVALPIYYQVLPRQLFVVKETTLLAEIKMETNKEDGLKGSIETRLAAREREQEALRKAIFHRLAEREAALKKAAAAVPTLVFDTLFSEGFPSF